MRIPELVSLMMAPVQYFTAAPSFMPFGTSGAQGGGGDVMSALGFSAPAAKAPTARTDTVSLGEKQPAQGALLDQFIRKRSVVSFSIPNLGAKMGGGAANFTFEIETAYRLITPIEPGVLVDDAA